MADIIITPKNLSRTLYDIANTQIGLRNMPQNIIIANKDNNITIAVTPVTNNKGVLDRTKFTINHENGWTFAVPCDKHYTHYVGNGVAIENANAIKAKILKWTITPT